MTIQDLKEKNLIIFEGIVGSRAYGTSTPTSDTDVKGVFMMPLEGLLNFDYVEQVSDTKQDNTYYELRRFLQLVQSNNPNILELLNLPEDCILHKDPIFDMILEHREKFISKACRNSFGGYAVAQIKKARGLNKKIVSPVEETRKDVLDFCYVATDNGSLPVKEYLEKNGMKQEFCGLVSVPNMRFTYNVFYDLEADMISKGREISRTYPPYKGIVQDLEKSNEVSLSSIPKTINGLQTTAMFVMQFNSDGYSVSCKKYREYWDWVEERNPHRFSDNMLHGKGYDGKNLSHCHRLLDMAIEITEGKGIIVRRENRDQLLSIRRGEYDYDTLVEEAEKKIERMDTLYDISNLPEVVDRDFVNNLLLRMRKERYRLYGL